MKKSLKSSVMLAVLLAALFSCEQENTTAPIRKGVILVVGHDVSLTFDGFDKIDTTHIASICQAIAKSGRAATIAFGTIGNPTDKSLIRCELKPLPEEKRNSTLSQKAENHQLLLSITKENQTAIEKFLKVCAERVQDGRHNNTDLNAFMKKASIFFSEPQFEGNEKILLLHSDGLHDLKGDTTLVCSIPTDCKFYACGWKNDAICKQDGSFDNPSGFVQFIQESFKN